MKYKDESYLRCQYLVVLYSSILEELDNGKTHAQIVRQMVKDGLSTDDAEKAYQLLSQNRNEAKVRITEMEELLKKAELEYTNLQESNKEMIENFIIATQKQEGTEMFIGIGIPLLYAFIVAFNFIDGSSRLVVSTILGIILFLVSKPKTFIKFIFAQFCLDANVFINYKILTFYMGERTTFLSLEIALVLIISSIPGFILMILYRELK